MVGIIVCVNVLASYFHTGLDLTREQRFTLSPATKNLLGGMQEVAVIDVYLQGKFPALLQRLQEATRERLRSFKEVAGNKIVFRFIDPMEGKTVKEQKQIAQDLRNKGVKYLQLSTQDEDEYSMKIFFPYALVQYNGREIPVMLLEDPPNKTAAERISYAEAMLEYKLASAIRNLQHPEPVRLGYIVGNGQELGYKTADMLANVLPSHYGIDSLDLGHLVHIPIAYQAVIICQPRQAFTGPEKLKIDQYIMRGGKVLWALNAMQASLDSLYNGPQFIAMEQDLGLDDMLFKYGVRVNHDLVEDMQCMKLPRGQEGGQPELHDWVYFPKLNPVGDHPIVKNMDFILGGFTNTIDTLKTTGIYKTILLHTSKYSRSVRSPARVSLSMMNYPLKHEMFAKSYLPVAVLIEGTFHSAYKNLLVPEYLRKLDSIGETFKPMCDSPNKMIVVSVGDIFCNDLSYKDSKLYPMGYYKYTNEFFANRNFLLNCIEYLTDESGILETRSKEMKLRLLDAGRAKDEKSKWQVINVAIPITIVLVFASAYFFFRKRRYEVRAGATTPNPPTH